MSTYIIRIERENENKHWVGLYQGLSGWLEETQHIPHSEYRRIFEEGLRHPAPYEDNMGYDWHGKLFGWNTYNKFTNWLTMRMLNIMKDSGCFRVLVFRLLEGGRANIVIGRSQCAFNEDKTECVFVGRIDENYQQTFNRIKQIMGE